MGQPGLEQGRDCESQAWEQPLSRRKLWNLHAAASTLNPPIRPAWPSPCPSSEPKSGLEGASPPHPGTPAGHFWEGRTRKWAACSPTAQREGQGNRAKGLGEASSNEAGAGAAAAGHKNAERNPGSPQPQLACSPQPYPSRVSATHSRPEKALERQASPTPLASKPCQALPGAWCLPKGQLLEATLEPKAKEQKSKEEALDTGAHRPRGQPRGGAGRVTGQNSQRFSLPNPTPVWHQPQPPALGTPTHPPKHGLGR